MLVLAHAGHWLANVAYLVPLLVLLAALAWTKLKSRGTDAQPPSTQESPPVDPAKGRRH